MAKRGKRIIVIPSRLAFGRTGVAGTVPPNSNMAIEVIKNNNDYDNEEEAYY